MFHMLLVFLAFFVQSFEQRCLASFCQYLTLNVREKGFWWLFCLKGEIARTGIIKLQFMKHSDRFILPRLQGSLISLRWLLHTLESEWIWNFGLQSHFFVLRWTQAKDLSWFYFASPLNLIRFCLLRTQLTFSFLFREARVAVIFWHARIYRTGVFTILFHRWTKVLGQYVTFAGGTFVFIASFFCDEGLGLTATRP